MKWSDLPNTTPADSESHARAAARVIRFAKAMLKRRYVTDWEDAEQQSERCRRQPHEPIRDQQDVDDLAAAPEDRLSPEEAAEFLKNIAECRGGEEGGNHGDA